MRNVHTSPWMKINLLEANASGPTNAAAPVTAELVIEGDVGWDPEKWWDGEVQANTKEYIRKELAALAELKATQITVRINSMGGSVNHGISIHDLLAQHPATVITIIEGMTASAATIIAAAGQTRRMSANGLFLAHHGMTWAAGNINDFTAAIGDLTAVDARIVAIYAKRSGRPEEEIADLMAANNGHGRWISADEAKALGMIDEIIEPRQIAASASLNRSHFAALALPPIPAGFEHVFAQTVQNPQTVQAGSPPEPPAKQESKVDKKHIANLKARFGADFALSCVEADQDYTAALEAGALTLAERLTATAEQVTTITAQRDTATARIAELEAAAADPLANSDPKKPADPPADPPAPLTMQAEFDALVASGKTKAEAYAHLRETRTDEYYDFVIQ